MSEIKKGDRVRSLYRTGEYAAQEGTVWDVTGGKVGVTMDSTGTVAVFDYFALQVFDPAPKTTHLWDVEHDFYGPDGCYYANMYQNAEWNHQFDSWAEFVDPENVSLASIGTGNGYSMGMNFLYRWDWSRPDPEDLEEDEYAGDTLQLFWLFPRKGMIGNTSIMVTEADEPAVREWLQRFADYMRDMWAPFNLSNTN